MGHFHDDAGERASSENDRRDAAITEAADRLIAEFPKDDELALAVLARVMDTEDETRFRSSPEGRVFMEGRGAVAPLFVIGISLDLADDDVRVCADAIAERRVDARIRASTDFRAWIEDGRDVSADGP